MKRGVSRELGRERRCAKKREGGVKGCVTKELGSVREGVPRKVDGV
jgi:hypothetical protein